MRTTADQARDGKTTRGKPRRTQRSTDRNERQVRSGSRLQRRHGNQGVQRLVREGVVQPKPEVGRPDDRYEREADRVAREVTRSTPSSAVERPSQDCSPEHVQRMCTRCKERYEAGKSLDCPECEKELQRKPDDGGGAVETAGLESELGSGGGRELPAGVRSTFESRIGHDFGGVRIHDDSRAARLNDRLGAKAFTYGRDIYFGDGHYRPETQSGQFLLAHELTHVVQQTGAAPVRVQRQEEEGDYEGGNRVVTLCDRNFNMPIQVPMTDIELPAGDLVPARHCFVWDHDESVAARPENIVQANTSTYDPETSGGPDAAATDDSVVCRATYDIDPSCAHKMYRKKCAPEAFNLSSNNCCSCARRAIEACGGSTSPDHFPPENQGIGLPEDYGGGWKRSALEGLDSGLQWGKDLYQRAKSGVSEGIDTISREGKDLLQWGESTVSEGIDTITREGRNLLERGRSGVSEGIDTISREGSNLLEWGKSTASETVDEVREFGSEVKKNVEYMNSEEFIFDLQRWLSGR